MMKHTLNVSVLILLSALFSAPATAATSMFLKIGNIQGESVVEGHEDEIDVLGWGWQISNSGTTHVGGGGSAGETQIGDISIIKNTDSASPHLYLAIMMGIPVDEAILTVERRGTDGRAVPYLVITLNEVLVTSARPGGASGEGGLIEQITLNFARLRIEYYPQNADGSIGAVVEISWDIVANSEL